MKRLCPVFIIIIIVLASCTRENTIIQGKLLNSDREYVYLDYLQIDQTINLDSFRIKKDGDFIFRIDLEHPGIYILRNEKAELINLIAKPDEVIEIEADYKNMDQNYSVSGSQESEYIRSLVEKIRDTRSRLDQLDESYGSLSSTRIGQASDYISQRKAIMKDQRDYSIQFIIEHLNSLASIYAIYQTIRPGQYVLGENRDIQYMKIVADSLSEKFPETPLVQSFVSDARSAESKYYNLLKIQEKMQDAEIGLPDIKLPNTNEDSASLSSLKGKIVMLYFWSSFSQESRLMNASLMEAYQDYKDQGFEIYAVSMDNNTQAWLNAVRFDELDWINVIDKTGSVVAGKYGVNKLPTSFLINREGDVVARDIFGRELRKWLDNLL